MDEVREVGGLKCDEVLALLSDYVDGELDDQTLEHLHAHLQGCHVCESFGGKFAGVIHRLRESWGEVAPLRDDVAERLRQKLDDDLTK